MDPPSAPPDQDASPPKVRKRWVPEEGFEAASMLRLLAVRPWLVAGRDDAAIAAVRRNLAAIRDALTRLGWVLLVERDVVRLRKSPPVRRDAWSRTGPSSLQASWFFLLVAGAESVAPRVALAQLIASARAAAAEARLSITNDISERRAIVRALHMLDERGIVEQVDGDIEGFVHDENAPVLLAVHHARLAHVIANFAPGDPAHDPIGWLDAIEREPDPARRMRKRLVDDTVVHAMDLDEAESDWLRRRVRGDDGGPLAAAFGLHLERRAEGAAFVVPEDAFRHPHELGPMSFPGVGTVQHAALLVCDLAAGSDAGEAGEAFGLGWRGLAVSEIVRFLQATAVRLAAGRGGWKRELAENAQRLAAEVRDLLLGLDLIRLRNDSDGTEFWWFSPATGRWQPLRIQAT